MLAIIDPLTVFGLTGALGFFLMVLLIVRDVVRHRRHLRAQRAATRAQFPPICSHGLPMTVHCRHCLERLNDSPQIHPRMK